MAFDAAVDGGYYAVVVAWADDGGGSEGAGGEAGAVGCEDEGFGGGLEVVRSLLRVVGLVELGGSTLDAPYTRVALPMGIVSSMFGKSWAWSSASTVQLDV